MGGERQTQIGHANHAIMDNGHALQLFIIMRKTLRHLQQKTLVYADDQAMNTRQQLGKHLLGPAFQRLGHDSMIGIIKAASDNITGFVPA